jgi:hypothetical protein
MLPKESKPILRLAESATESPFASANAIKTGIGFRLQDPRNLTNLDWIFRKKFKEVAGYDLPRPNRSQKEPYGPTKRRQ